MMPKKNLSEVAEFLTPLGRARVRLVQPEQDASLLHSWLTHPQSHFWGTLESTQEDITKEYTRILLCPEESAVILELDGIPYGLGEVYNPLNTELASVLRSRFPEQAKSTLGIHFLSAPQEASTVPRSGLTNSLFSVLVRWVFENLHARAILVEPDTHNEKIHAKNLAAGFSDVPGYSAFRLTMGGVQKTARIQICTPPAFQASRLAGYSSGLGTWVLPPSTRFFEASRNANRELLAKAIRELIHERLLNVDALTQKGWYRVQLGGAEIDFRAKPHALEHWSIDPASLVSPDTFDLSLPELLGDAAAQLQINPKFLPVYLEEIQATVAARTRVYSRPRPSSTELSGMGLSRPLSRRTQADHLQRVEGSMVEGHPSFIANSGRGGMGEAELRAWAPELSTSTPLVWLAARRDKCVIAYSSELGTTKSLEFWAEQLGPELFSQFNAVIRSAGFSPEDYHPLPVHPWQWNNRVTTTFASDLSAGRLIFVGTSSDLYRPQQSVRTFFNLSRPHLPYVKTALAVRNMGFLRGLSSRYMSSTPAINDWLSSTLGSDPEFSNRNVRLLKEIASIGYTGDVYHGTAKKISGQPGEHLKMLAALWRESPIPLLAADSLAVTLASVLHVDSQGTPLVRVWIEESGFAPHQWLARLLDVYLRPVIHALAAHGIVFMPHGENVILELHQGVPVGSFFKDLGEEVAVIDRRKMVPENISRIQADHGEFDGPQRALSIHTDVIDGVLRHLAALMADDGLVDEAIFWATARSCIIAYERDYPGTLDELPLLSPTFRHSCLNRLQLRNPLQMVDLGNQNQSLIYAGDISNPLSITPE